MDMAKTLHLYLLAALVPFVTAFEAPCIRCTGASRTAVPQLILTLKEEVDRRRNLAIISHPDAGKTTLTEKLLLYGGAIQSAGAVKAKGEQRRATSDFMAIEQERGISISTSVLTYEYSGKHVSILDTPGHQDFSEDTYRTLAAADNAVMLIDAAKGLEPQTRKLFEVARLRRLPLFTFVNKLDRPARTPYDICGEIEAEFGITCCPVVWPIGSGDRFRGVLDRRSKKVMLFERGERGKEAVITNMMSVDDPALLDALGDVELYERLLEDVELLDELMEPLDMAKVFKGEQTPIFFGSAMTNFGVQHFLDSFMELGAPPLARALDVSGATAEGRASGADFQSGAIADDAEVVDPRSDEFSGFVFKLQANLDPKHRDRMAYVRVCSGTFHKGLKVKHARLKGTEITLSSATAMLGNERKPFDDEMIAFPGDIIGLNNPSGTLSIGDTLYTGGKRISFAKIPSFSPEVFARCLCPSPSKAKSFNKGLDQLIAEGAVQLLRERGEEAGGGVPILAAVGPLQLEVVQSRMQTEYDVDVKFEPISYTSARWALAGWDAVDEAVEANKLLNIRKLSDVYGRPVLLFPSEWRLNSVVGELSDKLGLRPHALAPDVEERRRKK
ncbi:peptide chain release factor 3 [Chrysochromulina tobinii]|uniref:Peptide chain release factor 3 n=1 Tax=Chrysochromulina tobinii TaxID=1460289 RepID=A0A0M0K9V6_9EUKA|nr:peptide chain release factor 3 [Chrysochromulina tobinii]|eukprot:KOO35600.1 peptide chain release factor 3 [Chrysochromulina sp. CCMP291]